jgi:hypothetical protein
MAININKGSKLGKYYYQKDGVTYGPITIDELLERVDGDNLVYYEGISWTKAKDIPEISKFFKGNERTKIPVREISNKPTAVVVKETPKVSSGVENHKSGNSKKIVTAIILLLSATFIIGYFVWYKPYIKDKNATRMYSFASSLALRSSPVSGVDYNAIGNILYGTEILVYSNSGVEWSVCKANNVEGYTASKYLLSKQDFHLLNGIFADAVSRDAVATTKCKKALLDYFNSRSYMGKIDELLQIEIFDSVLHRDVWQLFAKNKDIKPNTIAFPRVVSPNSKFTDFACIITNAQSNKRKFLLFSFDDLEVPKLESEQDAPDTGDIEKVIKLNIDGLDSYFVTYSN